MLEKLTILDFQCHERLTIKFGQVTTIIGPSDIGKSAIIRALRLLLCNKPSGKAFIRDGAKFTRLKLTIDGHLIGRLRGAGKNVYRLDDQDLQGFNLAVPEPVEKLANVTEVNFQFQHDAPYWLSQPAPQVSRELNQIVDLGLIDTTMARFVASIRNRKADILVRKDYLEEHTTTLENLHWVPAATEAAEELGKLQEKLDTKRHQIDSMGSVLSDVSTSIENRDSLTAASTDALAVVSACKAASDAILAENSLSTLLNRIDCAKEAVDAGRPDTHHLDLAQKYFETDYTVGRLQWFLDKIAVTKGGIIFMRKQQQEIETELTEETEGVCPLCHQQMK